MTHTIASTEKCAESRPGQLFSAYLAARLPRIEAFIADNPVRALLVGEGGRDDDLGRDLYSPIEAFTARGGKRTRPALTLLGAEAVGGDAEAALPMAVAIEQFQSAALVHDDIADEGELRRGEPCLHLTCGVGPAINMGDAALVAGFSLLLNVGDADDATRLRLLRELARMEGHTVEGQALDLGLGVLLGRGGLGLGGLLGLGLDVAGLGRSDLLGATLALPGLAVLRALLGRVGVARLLQRAVHRLVGDDGRVQAALLAGGQAHEGVELAQQLGHVGAANVGGCDPVGGEDLLHARDGGLPARAKLVAEKSVQVEGVALG